MLKVRVDGAPRDEELLRDLPVGQAGGDQARDLPFARGELARQTDLRGAVVELFGSNPLSMIR